MQHLTVTKNSFYSNDFQNFALTTIFSISLSNKYFQSRKLFNTKCIFFTINTYQATFCNMFAGIGNVTGLDAADAAWTDRREG